MNRLSPLIVRRTALSKGTPIAVAGAPPADSPFGETDPGEWLENLKLFATGWIGGLVFFGTLLG